MKVFLFLASLMLALSACVGDDFINDFVQPEIRIASGPDSLTVDSSYRFSARYFNEVGLEMPVDLNWSSSDPTVASIDVTGLVTAHALGSVNIMASYDDGMYPATASVELHTAEGPVIITPEEPEARQGRIRTTSSYLLEGDFTITEDLDNDRLVISIAEDYRASSALPGLYVYLANNPNTTSGAYEIGEVTTFSGSHEYLVSDIDIDEFAYLLYFCKPFNVKVGDGEIMAEE